MRVGGVIQVRPLGALLFGHREKAFPAQGEGNGNRGGPDMHKLLTLALVAKACSRAVVTGTAREAVGRGMVVASPEAASRFEYFGFDGSG
jgi:hypothetical protein